MSRWNGSTCPESTGEHSPLDKFGRCGWCGRKVGTAMPRPSLGYGESEEMKAYRYYYDPDFGSDRLDAY